MTKVGLNEIESQKALLHDVIVDVSRKPVEGDAQDNSALLTLEMITREL
jgi:uncharacterized phage protein gp47/JayE